jgi:methionine aminotransferase
MQITITAGATQAIFTAITALIHPGEEVILFAPAYDCYEPAVTLQGAIPKWIHLHYPEYDIPWDEVKAAIGPKTTAIIINSPHNPTGKVWSSNDMHELQNIAEAHNLLIISDEVYEHIIFDGRTHESILRYPALAKRSLAVFSFGKTFHATGWKVGYVCASDEIMHEFRKVHQYNVFSVNTPVQYALAEYLLNTHHYLKLPLFYQSLRDKFIQGLENSRWKFYPAQGAYFQLLDFSEVSDLNDQDFAKKIIQTHKIATIPVSVFYPQHNKDRLIRICFAKDEDTLQRATEILIQISQT